MWSERPLNVPLERATALEATYSTAGEGLPILTSSEFALAKAWAPKATAVIPSTVSVSLFNLV